MTCFLAEIVAVNVDESLLDEKGSCTFPGAGCCLMPTANISRWGGGWGLRLFSPQKGVRQEAADAKNVKKPF